ncbi:MAG: restriction endonuclease subunit S [Wenzhouxiangellaceae bacterium]
MSWRELQLGDAIHVKHGFAFKGEHFSDYGSHVVLTPGNFNEEGGFRLRPGKDRFYSGDIPEDYILVRGDLITAMTEQGAGLLGSSALIPEDDKYLHNQRLGLIQIQDGSLIDKHFLYYLFNTRTVRGQISGSATGTKVRHTAPERIYRVNVYVPSSVIEQQRIASILAAYDNLIENNRRRIQLLEQSARLLYKEWFVHLRFPGHEHVKIKDGVPEGWDNKTAYDVMDVLGGGTPKTKIPDYWDGDIPFFTPKDAGDSAYVSNTEKTLTEDGLRSCNSKLYPKDTVFITARGTVGKINLAQTPMAMNQSCYALVAKRPLNQHYLYFALVDGVEQFRSRAVGAVFDAIIRDTFKMIPFLVPDEKIIQAFAEHAKLILRQIDVLATESRKLTQARDIFLPRLMNGEVAV